MHFRVEAHTAQPHMPDRAIHFAIVSDYLVDRLRMEGNPIHCHAERGIQIP